MSRRVRNRQTVSLLQTRGGLRRVFVHRAFLLLVCLGLVSQLACTSYELVQLPVRDADLYPYSETKAGIVVAIDQMSDSRRVSRYFGTDLLSKGILPVQVIVSNHGAHRVMTRPSDLLMLRGREVIDPLAIEKVREITKSKGVWVTDETAEQIDDYFTDLAFKEMLVLPGETVRGVLFFEIVEKPARRSRRFRLISLFPQPSFRLHLVVTDMEEKKRIPFGPFGVYRYY